ncbi:MAG: hypothetical protein KF799_11465 [Bdellovibrionales bacterium]|nr:hypothetical protein [Bdellovibrionales bacterium]
MATAHATLNPILRKWLRESLAAETVDLDCLGCRKPNKCCDFQPFVANFLLGAILERGGEIPVSTNIIFQPLGLIPSGEFRARHAAREEGRLGQEPLLRCSFLSVEGRCTIWQERPGECSTYLCTPPTASRMARSEEAFALETAVSQMALAYLGFSSDQIAGQIDFLNAPEHGWGPCPSQDEMFALYRRAWNWARELSSDEVRAWLE